MALYHYTFRGAMIVRFPRPAWRTGKAKNTKPRKSALDTLKLSARGRERLLEGISREDAERVIAEHDGGEDAVNALLRDRRPDMERTVLHEPSRFDIDDPFDLDARN
jgi:hypothetical protein